MNKIKNGKLPISAQKEIDLGETFEEMSLLDVEPKIKAHLESKGVTLRWINATKFKAAGGFNSKGWRPVKVSDIPEVILQGTGAGYGATAEGFMIRNDMMLAQRSKEQTDRHEKQLKQKAALAAGKTGNVANSMRENLGRYGKVIEGYEENSDD